MEFSRRNVLRAAGTGAAASVAGCLLGNEETGGSRLFVENNAGQEVLLQLVVATGEGIEGDRLLDEWYRVPRQVALEFEDVMEDEATHTVGVHAAEEGPEEGVQATVTPCEDDDAVTMRDVSVRVEPEAMRVVPWECQDEYTERDMEYVEAFEHRVDDPGDVETMTPAERT